MKDGKETTDINAKAQQTAEPTIEIISSEEGAVNEAASAAEGEKAQPAPQNVQSADLNGDGVVDEKEADIGEAIKTFGEHTVEPPKKKKFAWLSYVLLAVAIGLGIWAMFGIAGDMGESKSLGEVIRASSWQYAIVLLAVIIVILACDWFKYCVIMKTTTGKFSPRTSLKVQLLGKFYDNVTPFAVGGQPMQIYYLHKKGYSGGVSSAVILIKYFTHMFCVCFMCLIFMACNTDVLNNIDSTAATVIKAGAWVGITVNMFLPVMVLLFVLLPKFAHKLASFVIFLGYKLKIVKNREKSMEKTDNTVSEFRASFKIMSQKPLNFIALILLCVVEIFLKYALPFFVMIMFAPDKVHWADIIAITALNVYATQCVAVIPTPGNSGAIETSGSYAFSAYLTGAVLSWSVFTWRLSVYYIYIIIGLGLVIFDFIRKLVRKSRQKKESQKLP